MRASPAPLKFVLASAGKVVDLLSQGDHGFLGLLVDGGRFAVLCMTDFGPSARIYEDGGFELMAGIVSQSRGKVHTLLLSAGGDTSLLARLKVEGDEASRHHGGTDIDGFDVAIAAFRRVRQPQPVARTDDSGNEYSLSWSVAPLVGDEIRRGDVLTAAFNRLGPNTVIGWLDASRRTVGIHLVVPRAPLTDAEAMLEGTTGRVLEATYGLMPSPDGQRTVQTLMLETPTLFARAFPDGKIPRHGGMDLMERMAA